MSEPWIVASGVGLIGPGALSMESALHKILTDTRHEVCIAVYILTEAAEPIFELIENLLTKERQVIMIVNDLENQSSTRLKQLLKNLTLIGLQLYSFIPKDTDGNYRTYLHAKMIVVDSETALIGSFNFSSSALKANHELGVVVYNDAARQARQAFMRLLRSEFIVKWPNI